MKKLHNNSLWLICLAVMIVFTIVVVPIATYGAQGITGVNNEFTGTGTHTPPPETPDNPGGPDDPGDPGRPDDPGSPETPGRPDEPGEPDEPVFPEDPGIPGEPFDPGPPEEPDVPDTPVTPGDPYVPGNPPRTGDETDARLWLILLAVCACLLRHVLFVRKEGGDKQLE